MLLSGSEKGPRIFVPYYGATCGHLPSRSITIISPLGVRRSCGPLNLKAVPETRSRASYIHQIEHKRGGTHDRVLSSHPPVADSDTSDTVGQVEETIVAEIPLR